MTEKEIENLKIIRNNLVEVSNKVSSGKMPIEELLDFVMEKTDNCIDELEVYCSGE